MLGMKGCLKKKTKKVTMSEARTTPISEKAEEILRKPYARMIFPEDDGTFRGEVLEFPGCIVSGESAPEALCNLEEAANSWVSAAIELGQTIPEPVDAANNFSGRLVLRIPKSLHKKSSLFAEREEDQPKSIHCDKLVRKRRRKAKELFDKHGNIFRRPIYFYCLRRYVIQ